MDSFWNTYVWWTCWKSPGRTDFVLVAISNASGYFNFREWGTDVQLYFGRVTSENLCFGLSILCWSSYVHLYMQWPKGLLPLLFHDFYRFLFYIVIFFNSWVFSRLYFQFMLVIAQCRSDVLYCTVVTILVYHYASVYTLRKTVRSAWQISLKVEFLFLW